MLYEGQKPNHICLLMFLQLKQLLKSSQQGKWACLAARIQVFDTLAGPASGATSAPSKVSGTPSLGFGGMRIVHTHLLPSTSMKARSLWEGNPFTEQHSALLWTVVSCYLACMQLFPGFKTPKRIGKCGTGNLKLTNALCRTLQK